MAGKKISQFPNMTTLTGTEKLTGLQSNTNANATPTDVANYTAGRPNSIPLASLPQASASKLIGNPTALAANQSEIGITAPLAFSGPNLGVNAATTSTPGSVTLAPNLGVAASTVPQANDSRFSYITFVGTMPALPVVKIGQQRFRTDNIGTTETTLHDFSIAASTLAVDGYNLSARFAGVWVNTLGNTATWNIYINSILFLTQAIVLDGSGYMTADLELLRAGSNVLRSSGTIRTGLNGTAPTLFTASNSIAFNASSLFHIEIKAISTIGSAQVSSNFSILNAARYVS